MKRIFLICFLTMAGFAQAQDAGDPNEGTTLTPDGSSGTYLFSWWGRAGRSYFIQQSEDLQTWSYVPIIETGADQTIQWGFSSSTDKLFLRLKYTDVSTSDPFNDDFDGDGVSNWDELQQGSDPTNYYSQPGANGPVTLVPALSILSGNNQTSDPGTFAANPLVIQVTDSATGLPLSNAPVTFSVSQGGGKLTTANTPVAQQYDSVQMRTDNDGYAVVYQGATANVYYLQPVGEGIASQISATAGTAFPAQFTVTTNYISVPAAPTGVSVSTNSDGSKTIAWTDASNNETGFVISRSDDGGLTWSEVATVAANTVTCSVTAPSAGGSSSLFKVAATNPSGSSETGVDTTKLPAAPTNVHVTMNADGSHTYTWQDNSNNETFFSIDEQQPDGTWKEVGRVGPNQTSFTVPAPTP